MTLKSTKESGPGEMRPRKTKRVICRSEELDSIRPPRECVGRGGQARALAALPPAAQAPSHRRS